MDQIQKLEKFVSRMTPEQYARLLAFAESLVAGNSMQSQSDIVSRSPEATEAELLRRIQQGFPENLKQRLRELTVKSEAETLNDQERAEYISLAEQREAADAKVMQALLELAQLRGIPHAELMKELGVGANARG